MLWLRTLIAVALLIIGSLISNGHKNPLYFYWLSVTALSFILVEILIGYLDRYKRKLIESEAKVSSLTILKGANNEVLQISTFPKGKIIAGKINTINLYVTSIKIGRASCRERV